MELNKCLGCMEDFLGYPCPKCGYDLSAESRSEYILPPQTILAGKYLVGRVLGQGGFGITYIGWDIALERKVAIKEYYPKGQVSRNPGSRRLTWYHDEQAQLARKDGMEMFLKEARKMSRVDDIPGVVRVRELFQENDTAYIVMDFVEGETLKARLKRSGPMSWDQAKEIFRPAIRAMEEVHKAGLIHRDLSPDNLMLTPEGQVFILDLGAAKDLNVNQGASSMQVAKHGFSPFEQYTLRGSSGPWTDVYAMAATVYYTLTGIRPPTALDRVVDDPLSWSASGLETIPPSALNTLKSAMTVSVKDRIQSMKELEEGLFEKEPPREIKSERNLITPKKKPWKMIWTTAAAVAVVLGGILWWMIVKPAGDYKKAQTLMDAGQYTQAAAAFEALGGYQDSMQMVQEARELQDAVYQQALALTKFGQYPGAAIVFSKLGNYQDSAQRAEAAKKMRQVNAISAGGSHTVGLRSDGTVVAVGDNQYGRRNISNWSDIVSVDAGSGHTVGLHSDGTVVATGWNEYGQCDVSGWSDIVSVAATGVNTVGLCSDGTVVTTSHTVGVSDWADIVAVDGYLHIVGLRSNGTVVATGKNDGGQCDVSDWSNIVAIAAGGWHTVGLRSDGTVVAVGKNDYGQCEVSRWSNIVAIAAGAGGQHTVGLRSDGTVIAVGRNDEGQCKVGTWSHIIAISAGQFHTVGLRSDGTVVATGWNEYGQCDVDTWAKIRTRNPQNTSP